MKQRTFLAILLSTIVLASFAPSGVGLFEAGKGIGKPKLSGSSAIEGNFTVSADFAFVGKGHDTHRKVGWMVRESTDQQDYLYARTIPMCSKSHG